MKMLSDYELFKQLCDKRRITVLPDISEAMKNASSTGALRLPCQSIILPICEILGRVLASSSTITSVDLSDCMLISKGLTKILEALCEGSSITFLNLKGNNISGSVVSQLGEIFHRNNTLRRLNIEWNSLGTDTESFERFCEGLSANHSIEELDLRYNQISQLCAGSLSKVISRNKSIKIINLGRNNLGVQGGQAILSSLKDNSSIIKLNLRGNCIPEEILTIVDDLTYKNQSRDIQSLSNISKSKGLKSVVPRGNRDMSSSSEDTVEEDIVLKKKKVKQKNRISGWRGESTPFKNYGNDCQRSDDELNESVLSLNIVGEFSKPSESGNLPDVPVDDGLGRIEVNSKIAELNKILKERTAVINRLMKEISAKDSEIETTKSLVDRLELEIVRLKGDNERIVGEKLKEIEEVKEIQRVSEENWRKMQKDLEENYNEEKMKNQEWEEKAKKYENDIHRSSVALVGLREKFLSKSHHYEETISNYKTEIHRLKTELKERVNRHKIELNILKNTLKETTEALEECQVQLQKSRLELREVTENFSFVKSKLNEMENISVKYHRLEEIFQKLKEEKISIDEKFIDSQRTIASLRRQVNSLETELIEPQRRYNLLKEELEGEREKTGRLKVELLEERAKLKEQDCQMLKMAQQITSLNTQMSDAQHIHSEDIKERDRERKHLKEIIASKERDLTDLRAEEAQRAGQLYAAFTKYLGSIGSTNPL